MCESVWVLVSTDDFCKIFYLEEQTFALGSLEARKAKEEYIKVMERAKKLGYKISRKEKTVQNSWSTPGKV